ncbi:MAG TPA: T9SS type A sorting domain-containing protein [Bacteroidetes bacterium]|nr:hypothetical protein BMS3Bbin04_01851 [bacterium BMS3Bbin04]HDO64543.1 T9SS type A sorting domain-containing protein [Bacteroidota bacterium]HEX03668.1 T9SS type A sorting domain-containing protein [Bacteroidota bacterium]
MRYLPLLIALLLPALAYPQLAWESHVIDGAFEGAFEVCVADVNSDGTKDVIGTAYFGDDIVWYDNIDGTGLNWLAHSLDSEFLGATSPDAADIDGDGDCDILAAADGLDEIAWWENVDGEGLNWTKHSIDAAFDNAESVRAADIDGDGDQDVIGAAWVGDDIVWYENTQGDGLSWTPHSLTSEFDGANCAIAADVDSDGDLDIIGSASIAGDVTWWENLDGNGLNWSEHVIDGEFSGAYFVHATDVDLDGDLDVLGAAYLADEIALWVNMNGDGTVWEKRTVGGNYNGAWSVSTDDIDDDGDIDILGAAAFADDISWWEDADGNSQNWIKHTIDGNFDGARCVVTADLDQDGDSDIIGAAQLDYSIAWWEQVPFPVQLTLTPTSPLTIPAEGGTLVYDAQLVSTLPNAYPGIYYWTSLLLPNGNEYGPLLTQLFNLQSYMDYTGVGFTQNIPGYAQAGDYEFIAHVGYQQGLNISDSFAFSKEGVSITSRSFVSWESTGSFTAVTSDESIEIPIEFQVSDSYPNPFNPATTVSVVLPKASKLNVTVVNILGQQVAELANGQFSAGNHNLTFDASNMASGLYFIHASVPGQMNQVQKVMLVR